MTRDLTYGALVLTSLLVTTQSAHTLYRTVYTWDRPPLEVRAPCRFVPPRLSFTVMLAARHQEAVSQAAIDRVGQADYPVNLIQILVIDEPQGLSAALRHAAHDVVTVLDADDDIHPQIFNVVNTVMQTEGVKVVQCGVQPVNGNSGWYSALNVLENFFWFKSLLQYHASYGAVPLGRNTVFSERALISRVGGWDNRDLTGDADIGLRLSASGERIRVVYDDRYVTKAKIPAALGPFIRQRTDWNHGFMRTLRKGKWKALPTRRQRWLAFYTLASRSVPAMLGVYLPFWLAAMLAFRPPVLVAIIACLPIIMLLAHLLAASLGLYEFTREHGLHASPGAVARMAVAWFPYQLVVAYAALRGSIDGVAGRKELAR